MTEHERPPLLVRMGTDALRKRATRLSALIADGAPPRLLANELLLLQEALVLIDPDAWGSAVAARSDAAVRTKFRLCHGLTCSNPLQPSDKSFCAGCVAEQAAEEADEANEVV